MFERITPEAAGISSDKIVKFIDRIEKRGAIMHSILMMRNGKVFNENYWAPFDKDFCHRMYSQTKSYAAIGIGLLEEEGKLSLDDKVCDIFRGQLPADMDERWEEVTVDNVLRHRMGTTKGYLDIDVEDINTYPTDDLLSMVFSALTRS